MRRFKHHKYLLTNSKDIKFIMTLKYIKKNIYECEIYRVDNGASRIVNYTQGQLAQKISLGIIKPISDVEIALLLLSN